MQVTYELTFSRQCPVDDTQDIYQVCIETSRILKVEFILAEVAALPEKTFQEDLTVALATKLAARVTLTGYHSGVKTTVTA